jgi:hypothetical protein
MNDSLIRATLDQILLAIDAAGSEKHEQARVHIELATALHNINPALSGRDRKPSRDGTDTVEQWRNEILFWAEVIEAENYSPSGPQ